MKKLREILGEMKLDNLPVDYSDVIDLRGQKPRFKAGDKWASGMWGSKGKVVTQKQADDVNSGREAAGSPFPNSWRKDTQVADKTPSAPKMPEKKKVADTENNQEMSTNDRIKAWLKQNPIVDAAIKKDKAKMASAEPTSVPTPKPAKQQTYMTSVRPNNPLPASELSKPKRTWSTQELDNLFK